MTRSDVDAGSIAVGVVDDDAFIAEIHEARARPYKAPSPSSRPPPLPSPLSIPPLKMPTIGGASPTGQEHFRLSGKAGTISRASRRAVTLIRIDRIMAMDTSQPTGSGTVIESVRVGPTCHLADIPTYSCLATAIGFEIAPFVVHAGMELVVSVKFLVDCDFSISLRGRRLA